MCNQANACEKIKKLSVTLKNQFFKSSKFLLFSVSEKWRFKTTNLISIKMTQKVKLYNYISCKTPIRFTIWLIINYAFMLWNIKFIKFCFWTTFSHNLYFSWSLNVAGIPATSFAGTGTGIEKWPEIRCIPKKYKFFPFFWGEGGIRSNWH